jgi:predicted RNA-binding Zn ribbon-like protein
VVRIVARRTRAPGELELVRSFLNTAVLAEGRERLGDAGDLAAWLRGHELLGRRETVAEGDCEVAVAVREALRDLVSVNTGVPMPAASSDRLDAVVAACGLRPRFERDGAVSLAPEVGGVGGALGRLLGIVVAAVPTDGWARLKACRNPGCRWAFYDSTRNRSAVWCDMALCGSRAKSRAYYARRRG